MTAYIIVEDQGEWSAARIESPVTTFNAFGGASPGWFHSAPIYLSLSGNTLDHAHQLETLEETIEHVKKWISQDARKRLGEKQP